MLRSDPLALQVRFEQAIVVVGHGLHEPQAVVLGLNIGQTRVAVDDHERDLPGRPGGADCNREVASVSRTARQVEDHRIRMLKLGNVMSVTLHLRPADDFRVERIADLDRVRRKIEEALAPLELEIGLDVLFVDDMKLAR